MKTEIINSFDETHISTRTWDNVKQKKGVVLIVHGMSEHINRYDAFAKFLNQNGYICFGFDLRAHGQSAKSIDDLGKYQKDLFADSVSDIIFFSNLLHERYKDLPLFVFGHSFGSFLTQRYIEKYDNFSGVIICGSANMKNQASVSFGKVIANITKCFCGKNAKAKMIAKASFGAYEKHFEDKNWLTRDTKIFKAYNDDPYCGFVCSANFYCSFFKNLKIIYKSENLAQINKDRPIFIISGKDDPVGGFEKLVIKLYDLYKKWNIKKLQIKTYEKARHELLNETNKEEVFDDILSFLNSENAKSTKKE